MKTRLLLFFLCSMALLAGSAYAEVIANFTDGNDDDTYVDAFHGVAGGGWSDAWVENLNTSNATVTTLADNSTPISGGGYCLSSTVAADQGTSDVRFAVGRDHGDGVDETVPQQRIEFDFRIDEDVDGEDSTFTVYQDRYMIFDGDEDINTASSHSTWSIYGYAGTGTYCPEGREMEWTFCDGANSSSGSLTNATWVDTDIKLQHDGVYEFVVDLYPAAGTWDCEVTHVNPVGYSPDPFKETGMGWRDNVIADDFIYFSSRTYGSDDVRAFSVDNVSVSAVPEPSTFVLLALGLIGLAAYTRRRR